jgi:hypothetical protein
LDNAQDNRLGYHEHLTHQAGHRHCMMLLRPTQGQVFGVHRARQRRHAAPAQPGGGRPDSCVWCGPWFARQQRADCLHASSLYPYIYYPGGVHTLPYLVLSIHRDHVQDAVAVVRAHG